MRMRKKMSQRRGQKPEELSESYGFRRAGMSSEQVNAELKKGQKRLEALMLPLKKNKKLTGSLNYGDGGVLRHQRKPAPAVGAPLALLSRAY
jgi:hypothetical protein